MKLSWDIFCSVVDNYGDIGVTWRLARQLVAEHQQRVRLWVDDLNAYLRICPEAEMQPVQWQAGVEVRQWLQPWQAIEPADVVIEAFACELPGSFRQAMKEKTVAPMWLNLEYLSAEDWVAGCHGLPSLQVDGLRKFMFFPGFTDDTGGLLRETGLLENARAVSSDRAAKQALLSGLGVDWQADEQLISVFCYEQPQLASWLEVLAKQSVSTLLLVPDSRVRTDVEAFLGASLALGEVQQRGQLRIQLLPFVEQSIFDQLLWVCDFNVVRGEDSLLRGLWAQKPMLWDIYKQDEDVHLEKLDAFFSFYTQGLSGEAAGALRCFFWAWNQRAPLAEGWLQVRSCWPELQLHARMRAEQIAQVEDLATRLVHFCLD